MEKRIFTTAGKPAKTLGEITQNVRALQQELNAAGVAPRDSLSVSSEEDYKRELAAAELSIAELEAKNHDLRNRLQIYAGEIGELHLVLRGLVSGLEGLPADNWILKSYLAAIGPEISQAREVLARMEPS